MTDYFCWVPGHNAIVWNIFDHNRACTHSNVISDSYSTDYCHIRSQRYIVADDGASVFAGSYCREMQESKIISDTIGINHSGKWMSKPYIRPYF